MSPEGTRPRRTYTPFHLTDLARQTVAALRRSPRQGLESYLVQIRRDLARLESVTGRELVGLKVLEVGPGQNLGRAHVLGMANEVTAVDLDVVPDPGHPTSYLRAARTNGVGRAVKSLGREVLVGRRQRRAWVEATGADAFVGPVRIQGDVCRMDLGSERFDAAVSWSVFEHLDDPSGALARMVDSLVPGGGLFVGIHLYTAHDGHHDMRAFTGAADALPPWPHLRTSTRHLVRPSAHLNEWRLDDYRAMVAELLPGATEYLDQYEVPDTMGQLLEGPLRAELGELRDEELLTVNACYAWRKPGGSPHGEMVGSAQGRPIGP